LFLEHRIIRHGAPAFSRRAHPGVVIESEFTALGRSEERASSVFVCVRHSYFDRPQSVERQPVSVSQRFAAQGARNPGRFQECADLLRVNLTVRDEYDSLMLIHGRTPLYQPE
jgi:hypothetical protein